MLDPVQQRVIGVLIEKERTVPDSYPLTEAQLIAGCNQKSNRDPEMDLDNTELHPALLALREDGWVARVEGNRATRYRHRVEERLNVNADEQAVLCELLCRGPQAPGALKPRVARMGLHADPARIEAILEGLASRAPTPLVERQPKRPRERDHRWGHLLGPRPSDDEQLGGATGGEEREVWVAADPPSPQPRPAAPSAAPTPVPPTPVPAPDRPGASAEEVEELRDEVRDLQARVASLEDAIRDLRGF